MKGISIKAIIIAAIVVLVADVIAGVGLAVVIGQSVALSSNTSFLIGSAVLGTLTTILGGYVAARTAKMRYYANAAGIGILGFLIGILTAKEYPLWFNTICFISVIPAAILGGHLAKHTGKSNA